MAETLYRRYGYQPHEAMRVDAAVLRQMAIVDAMTQESGHR